MAGILKNDEDRTKEQICALLEHLLDKAAQGKIDYLCVVFREENSNQVAGRWRGTNTGQKAVDAAKGLKALARKILDAVSEPPE